MNLIKASEFLQFDPEALDVYCGQKAGDVGLTIPNAYRPGVLENLAALQAHAETLCIRLDGAEPPPSRVTPP